MDRSLPSQKSACYALVGLLTPEFGPSGLLVVLPAVTPDSFNRQWPGDWRTAIVLLAISMQADERPNELFCPINEMRLKTLGYSGGAVPESHRVPCMLTLPQERPTTSTQFKQASFYGQSRETSSGSADQETFEPAPVHGHHFQRQPLPCGAITGYRNSSQNG
jgi:hypothetical protein